MRITPFIVVALGVVSGLGFGSPQAAEQLRQKIEASRIVDLTHQLHDAMAYWPGGIPFKKIRLVDYGEGYRLHKFEMGENTGTHVDAPAHFVKDRPAIDRLALADLVVRAVVIDVRDKVAADADYRLAAGDVLAWEARNGLVPAGALAILNTGWHKRFDTPASYVNMDAGKIMHFPGYGKEAAELLLARGVVGIGIDTLSIDHGPSRDFAVHFAVLGTNKYMIENLANLDALPPTGATVIVGVLPVREGTQAQARVLALLP